MKSWIALLLVVVLFVAGSWLLLEYFDSNPSNNEFLSLDDETYKDVQVLDEKLEENAYSHYNQCILDTETDEGYLFYCIYGDDRMSADWYIERAGEKGEIVKSVYQEYVESGDEQTKWKEYKTVVYDEEVMSQFSNQAQELHSIGVTGRSCSGNDMLVIKAVPNQADALLSDKLDEYNDLKKKGYSLMDFCVEKETTGSLLFDASRKVSELIQLEIPYDQIYPYENDIVVAYLMHDKLTYVEIEVNEMCMDCPGEPFCQADSMYEHGVLFMCSWGNDAGTITTWYAYDFDEEELVTVKEAQATLDYGLTKGGDSLVDPQSEVFDESLLKQFNHQTVTYE